MDFRLRFFQLLLFIINITPKFLVPFLTTILVILVMKFAKKDKIVLQKNIEKIWNLPANTTFSNMFMKQVIRHQVVSMLETIKGINNPEILKIEGQDELEKVMEEAEKSQKGMVYITGHLGSWELAGLSSANITKKSFHALAKPMKYKKITDFLSAIRKKAGVDVLWTSDKSLVRSMITIMKSGEWLAFVMDQKPDSRKGSMVKFFNQETIFVNGPATMATKFNAPIIAVFCMRIAPFHYKIYSKELLPANHGESDNVKICQLMASEIERVIRLYPEQWCWNYKRWKF